jgi:hypothetical protein
MSGKVRSKRKLSEALEHKLGFYALSALTAGASALFSAKAEAQVIYTPTWIPVPAGLTNLDLNNDGNVDFVFSNRAVFCSSTELRRRNICADIKVLPQLASNAVWGTNGTASALSSGVTVGSKGKFQSGHEFMAEGTAGSSGATSFAIPFYRSNGPWREATRLYLGLKFEIEGEVHYGWARLNVCAAQTGIYAAVGGYAFESQPNTPIVTGQESGSEKKKDKKGIRVTSSDVMWPAPGSVGMLAAGAPGLQAVSGPGTTGK